ncbi:carbon-monoxide dehydrogenase small subunit [Rhodoligotrophos appendicifer]|uniref:(2Fe-2S)-binding protein n=1 Tax=Rhodoligotrophos appendicifer TaxID=987056 RepID=UPI001186DCE0|nr:(2Fe-2S)-binding protein [Rhodoligotrophos appendicifer]
MTRSPKQMIELDVDGEVFEVNVRPHQLLVDVIRDGCGRMSVKEGCETASCGACTVLIDDIPTLACITLAADAVGHKICTAESLSTSDGKLHPLQQAFIDHHAIQCGFCTPGMLLSGVALVKHTPSPTEDEIRAAIGGNMCRCTGYIRIVRAIADFAQKANQGPSSRAKELVS